VRYVDEYRDGEAARKWLDALRGTVTRPWTLMEICGGQTHTLLRSGIDRMLPDPISLVHGPGCPVCVTPVELIDKAVALARRSEIILTSFGDMLRVPGSETDLLTVKAEGGDVRMVYSPLDALELARKSPDREVVFFAVGFETTAPANAMAVWRAHRLGVPNFSILSSHVLVPPAIEAILSAPDNRVQGFLAAGHVCAVMGYWQYLPLAEEHRLPITVTGFEPLDLLQGVWMTVKALEEGRWGVENQYSRAVTEEGNRPAQELLRKVFRVVDRPWRGIGTIPESGLALRPELARFDAERRFAVEGVGGEESPLCIAGEVLRGLKKPPECPAFGGPCTPDNPLGAPMVSSEGACAAYHLYGRLGTEATARAGVAEPPGATGGSGP
jgi:hydrogenase expression/formation protein HypD